jgi:hypothetical protein
MKEMNGWLTRVSGGQLSGMYSLPYTLENGGEQLEEFFSSVSLSRYQDSLEVTEVDPVIAYIRSGIAASDLLEEELGRVRHGLEMELQEKGRIFISKDSGLFEAIK